MEIRAEELRIGNYAMQDDLIVVMSTIGIDSCCSVGFKDGSEIIRNRPIEMFKPIPLTEEWLLKLGFELYAKGSIAHGWKKGINPVTKDYMISLTQMHNNDGTKAEIFYRNGHHVLKYVHQLQNLYFALTSEELTIKN